MAEYDPVARFYKWLEANVRDPLPMDDKSRIHEYFEVLSTPDSPTMYKDFALKGFGMMAMKYSASPIILCGALPVIKEQLFSPCQIIVSQAIRTLTFIANHGGQQDICNEKIHLTVRQIISNKNMPQYVKDAGLKFYFKILDEIPLDHSF